MMMIKRKKASNYSSITYVAYSFIFGTRKEQQNLQLKKQKRLRKEKTGIMKKLMVRKEQSEVTINYIFDFIT